MKNTVQLNRSQFEIKEGALVQYQEEIFKIIEILDLEEVLAVNLKTGKIKTINIKSLKHVTPDDFDSSEHMRKDILDITTKEWELVKERVNAIQPIIDGDIKSIAEHAKNIGIHHSTLYHWYNSYCSAGGVSGLLPKKEGRREGLFLIDSQLEKIIQEVISSHYLTKQKPKVEYVIRLINIECKNMNIKSPSNSTIRRRIAQVDDYLRLSKRHDKSAARDKYQPTPGHFEADCPLSVVQMDHTPVDIILVNEHNREPIGRPYLTVAIDIYSRMIHGYYLSFDPPSATSVAMCMISGVLPKDKILFDMDIDAEWNVWGFMNTLHTDNGADFISEAVSRGCALYNIHQDKRPVGKSNFGGHVERVLGTIMSETHNLPGTTFSNIKEKGKYDPDKHATMTLKEYERWLVTFITQVYHKRVHSSLGMSPEQKYEEGILGTPEKVGAGFQPKPSDPQAILLDFLPLYRRTVQKNGINIDGLNYYDSVIRTFINDVEKKEKKKFIIKRDPRDISQVWFYDDKEKQYYRIPLSSQSIPSMTSWEWKKIKEDLKEKYNTRNNSATEILEGYEKMNSISKDSGKLTRKKQLSKERKKHSTEQMAIHNQRNKKHQTSTPDVDNSVWEDEIPEFEVE